MIYINTYRGVRRARCRDCIHAWFEKTGLSDNPYSFFGQCVDPDTGLVLKVPKTKYACPKFKPLKSFTIYSSAEQLSLF